MSNDLWLIHSEKSDLKKVAKDYKRYVFLDSREFQITVFAGSETDLATIPRLLWSIFPKDGAWAEAAVIHDYLYCSGKLPQLLCDKIFKKLLTDDKINSFVVYLFYSSVRTFGWIYFKSKNKRGEMAGKIRVIDKRTKQDIYL